MYAIGADDQMSIRKPVAFRERETASAAPRGLSTLSTYRISRNDLTEFGFQVWLDDAESPQRSELPERYSRYAKPILWSSAPAKGAAVSAIRRFWALSMAALAVVNLVGAGQAMAAEPHAEAIERFRAFAKERIEHDPIPGLSVGFVTEDFLWADGFGWADLENRVPANAESAYRLASVTKPMTAIAALKLVEQGKLDLDAEVQTYVPDFPRKAHPVTTRQLLGHLGGISHYQNYDLEGHFKDHKNTEQSLAVFADFRPGCRAGHRVQLHQLRLQPDRRRHRRRVRSIPTATSCASSYGRLWAWTTRAWTTPMR